MLYLYIMEYDDVFVPFVTSFNWKRFADEPVLNQVSLFFITPTPPLTPTFNKMRDIYWNHRVRQWVCMSIHLSIWTKTPRSRAQCKLGLDHNFSLSYWIWTIFQTIVVDDQRVCHGHKPRSYLQSQGNTAHLEFFFYPGHIALLTVVFDLDVISNSCCQWLNGVSRPWLKVISQRSGSHFTHSEKSLSGPLTAIRDKSRAVQRGPPLLKARQLSFSHLSRIGYCLQSGHFIYRQGLYKSNFNWSTEVSFGLFLEFSTENKQKSIIKVNMQI